MIDIKEVRHIGTVSKKPTVTRDLMFIPPVGEFVADVCREAVADEIEYHRRLVEGTQILLDLDKSILGMNRFDR